MPLELDAPLDSAYPLDTPPDPVYPGQTRAPLASPLDEIATPSIWSVLAHPLERAQLELWQALGLFARAQPTTWVAIHYGRIALNAHAWERLRARANGSEPDPGLVEPAQALAARLSDRIEAVRARLRRGALARRIERAEKTRDGFVKRGRELDPTELDAGELARGPLDERAWSEILLPGLGHQLISSGDTPPSGSDACLRAAIALEQSFGHELGARLTTRRTLAAPSLVAYLTVPERIRAVLDGASHWSELATARQERVEQFAKLDLPREFWGRPRPDAEKA
jgi:hypothetical protein